MLRSKKFVSITITLLLIASIGTIIPVKADTDVTVYTVGDVTLTVNITNGSLLLIYDGIDILAEIHYVQQRMFYLQGLMYTFMSTYATQESLTNLEQVINQELYNLNQTVSQLVGELDVILEDLYGKTNFLAYVIGLDSNSSIIATNLMSGNYTIVNYLDSIITTLDNVDNDLLILEDAISEIRERLGELEVFKLYALEQFNATYLEIENLVNYTDTQLDNLYNELLGEIQTLEISTIQFVNSTYIELNERRESLRQDVLADLIILEGLIQVETNRQDFTELEVQNLQQRLYDVENVLGLFVIISIVLAILLVAVVIKRKLSKPKPLQ